MAVFCFVGVLLVRMGKAALDTADYNYQMLRVARQQLAVSHKALLVDRIRFSELRNALIWKDPVSFILSF